MNWSILGHLVETKTFEFVGSKKIRLNLFLYLVSSLVVQFFCEGKLVPF